MELNAALTAVRITATCHSTKCVAVPITILYSVCLCVFVQHAVCEQLAPVLAHLPRRPSSCPPPRPRWLGPQLWTVVPPAGQHASHRGLPRLAAVRRRSTATTDADLPVGDPRSCPVEPWWPRRDSSHRSAASAFNAEELSLPQRYTQCRPVAHVRPTRNLINAGIGN